MACLASRKVTQKNANITYSTWSEAVFAVVLFASQEAWGLVFPWSGLAFMSSVQCGGCCLATRRYTIFLSFPL